MAVNVLYMLGSHKLHRFHWELLKHPDKATFLGLNVPLVRRPLYPSPQLFPNPSSQAKRGLNILLVVARPFQKYDVGFRSISKALAEALGIGTPGCPYKLDIVRPGTMEALEQHLVATTAKHGKGYYDIIHFDVHGVVDQTEDTADHVKPERKASPQNIISSVGGAYLLFQNLSGEGVHRVAAVQIVALVKFHQIPTVVMNSCESGRELGAPEDSMARVFSELGSAFVVGFAYTVTVAGAVIFTKNFYQGLRLGQPHVIALMNARKAMAMFKARQCSQWEIDYEDWSLPVAFGSASDSALESGERMTEQMLTPESIARDQSSKPHFHGRDLDILELEKALLLRSNIVPVFGSTGIGKTALLRFLGSWWRETGFIEAAHELSLPSAELRLDEILNRLLTVLSPKLKDTAEGGPAQNQTTSTTGIENEAVEVLKQRRILLYFDNINDCQKLDKKEIMKIKRFLSKLEKGKVLVLLSSSVAGPDNAIVSKYAAYGHTIQDLDSTSVGDEINKGGEEKVISGQPLSPSLGIHSG